MYLAGCLAWAAAITATVAYTPASTTGTDLIAANTIFNLAIREVKKAWTSGYKRANTCDLGSVAIRKEW